MKNYFINQLLVLDENYKMPQEFSPSGHIVQSLSPEEYKRWKYRQLINEGIFDHISLENAEDVKILAEKGLLQYVSEMRKVFDNNI